MAIPIRDVNPTRSFPIVTKSLIFINIAVFIYQLLDDRFTLKYALVPALAFVELHRWVTHMFLHGGLLHLVGNMIYLWVFGDNVEDRYGHFKFLTLYITWGLAAAFTHYLYIQIQAAESPTLAKHMFYTPALGASGAISGVLGAYVVLYPHAKIQTLLFFFIIAFIEVPAWVYIGFWFFFQLYYGALEFLTIETTGVAYFAHIGGFVAGLLTALATGRRKYLYRYV